MTNRNFEMYQYREIIFQMRQGQSDRAIAKLKLAGRAKSNQIRQIAVLEGWLSLNEALPDDVTLAARFKTQSQPRQSLPLVTPYADQIKEWFEQRISARTVFSALVRKYQYTGSYDSVKRYMRNLRQELGLTKATCVLHFNPAEAAQIDFGKGPRIIDVDTGEEIDSWIFVMTLCFSRHMYIEIIRNQTVETWLGCHRRAFEFFGGVAGKMIIDNAKCAITKACFHDPEVQRSYADFAQGYGFIISPCPPREPQMKGRVESGVKYVKGSFVPLRTFRSLSDANAQARAWVLAEAGNRTHGSTYQQPLTAFTELEKHLLNPLPPQPVELATWVKVKVHGDCHIQYLKCRYSVPYRYVKQILWVRVNETTVRVYHEHDIVAMHVRRHQAGKIVTVPEHMPPNAQAYLMKDPTWCRKQAATVGQDCSSIIEALFNDKVLDNLRTAQGILSLSKKYGKARLNAACRRAEVFNSRHYKTIKGILKNGTEYDTLPDEQAFDLLSQAYTQGRFLRQENNPTLH